MQETNHNGRHGNSEYTREQMVWHPLKRHPGIHLLGSSAVNTTCAKVDNLNGCEKIKREHKPVLEAYIHTFKYTL